MTVASLLDRERRQDAARPLLTWYDDADGARVELSVATTANWAAKIAGHLVDEYDAGPGTSVTAPTAVHWISVVLAVGVWTCGAAVRLDEADDVVDVDLDPMGLALSRLVGAQPDDFVPIVPVDPDALALGLGGREWSHAELAHAAIHGATSHGLDRSSRVLSTLGYDTVDGLDAGLLVPLAAGGSVVLVANAIDAGLAERCRVERVTHTAGVSVNGVPRLA